MAKSVQDILPGGGVATAGSIPNRIPGDRKRTWKVITGDTAYPAGGYPIAPADLGFAFQIDYITIINDNSGPTGGVAGLNWFWNRATQKLQLIVASTNVENATADVHLSSCDILAEGY